MKTKGRPIPLLIAGLAACAVSAALFGLKNLTQEDNPSPMPTFATGSTVLGNNDAKTDAEADVEAAFEAYCVALLNADGASALSRMSASTIAMYEQFQEWAITASKDELHELSLGNRMSVLILRHRVPPDELRAMDGAEAFVYAVDHGWIGKDGTARIQIGDIAVRGNRATARTLLNGAPVGETHHFVRENGAWKFDLTGALKDVDQILQQRVRAMGVSEDEFLVSLITSLSGRQVKESIWQPLQ